MFRPKYVSLCEVPLDVEEMNESELEDEPQKFLFKLSDRLGNPLVPDQAQLMNMRNEEPLYMSPHLFESFMNGLNQIKLNPYKNDVFALGLIILEAGLLEPIQNLYNYETGEFQYGFLENYKTKFFNKYDDAILRELLDKILEVEEEKRVTPIKLQKTVNTILASLENEEVEDEETEPADEDTIPEIVEPINEEQQPEYFEQEHFGRETEERQVIEEESGRQESEQKSESEGESERPEEHPDNVKDQYLQQLEEEYEQEQPEQVQLEEHEEVPMRESRGRTEEYNEPEVENVELDQEPMQTHEDRQEMDPPGQLEEHDFHENIETIISPENEEVIEKNEDEVNEVPIYSPKQEDESDEEIEQIETQPVEDEFILKNDFEEEVQETFQFQHKARNEPVAVVQAQVEEPVFEEMGFFEQPEMVDEGIRQEEEKMNVFQDEFDPMEDEPVEEPEELYKPQELQEPEELHEPEKPQEPQELYQPEEIQVEIEETNEDKNELKIVKVDSPKEEYQDQVFEYQPETQNQEYEISPLDPVFGKPGHPIIVNNAPQIQSIKSQIVGNQTKVDPLEYHRNITHPARIPVQEEPIHPNNQPLAQYMYQPVHEPSHHQPLPNQPMHAHLINEPQMHHQQMHMQPVEMQPVQMQPVHTPQMHTQPMEPQSKHIQQMHTQPMEPQSIYTQPMEPQSIHTQPMNNQQMHAQPMHTQPMHHQAFRHGMDQPVYTQLHQPVYHQNPQPTYHQGHEPMPPVNLQPQNQEHKDMPHQLTEEYNDEPHVEAEEDIDLQNIESYTNDPSTNPVSYIDKNKKVEHITKSPLESDVPFRDSSKDQPLYRLVTNEEAEQVEQGDIIEESVVQQVEIPSELPKNNGFPDDKPFNEHDRIESQDQHYLKNIKKNFEQQYRNMYMNPHIDGHRLVSQEQMDELHKINQQNKKMNSEFISQQMKIGSIEQAHKERADSGIQEEPRKLSNIEGLTPHGEAHVKFMTGNEIHEKILDNQNHPKGEFVQPDEPFHHNIGVTLNQINTFASKNTKILEGQNESTIPLTDQSELMTPLKNEPIQVQANVFASEPQSLQKNYQMESQNYVSGQHRQYMQNDSQYSQQPLQSIVHEQRQVHSIQTKPGEVISFKKTVAPEKRQYVGNASSQKRQYSPTRVEKPEPVHEVKANMKVSVHQESKQMRYSNIEEPIKKTVVQSTQPIMKQGKITAGSSISSTQRSPGQRIIGKYQVTINPQTKKKRIVISSKPVKFSHRIPKNIKKEADSTPNFSTKSTNITTPRKAQDPTPYQSVINSKPETVTQSFTRPSNPPVSSNIRTIPPSPIASSISTNKVTRVSVNTGKSPSFISSTSQIKRSITPLQSSNNLPAEGSFHYTNQPKIIRVSRNTPAKSYQSKTTSSNQGVRIVSNGEPRTRSYVNQVPGYGNGLSVNRLGSNNSGLTNGAYKPYYKEVVTQNTTNSRRIKANSKILQSYSSSNPVKALSSRAGLVNYISKKTPESSNKLSSIYKPSTNISKNSIRYEKLQTNSFSKSMGF